MKTSYTNTMERAEVELEIIRENGQARPNQDKIDLMVYNLLSNSDYALDDEDFRQAIAAYTRIANGNPLTVLTGDADEWDEEPTRQVEGPLGVNCLWNKRAPNRVYLTDDGRVFCKYGRIFKRPDGTLVPSPFCDIEVQTFPFRVPGRPKTVVLYGNESPEQWYMRNLGQGKITG